MYECQVINVNTNLRGRSGPSISSPVVTSKKNGNSFKANQVKTDSSGYTWYHDTDTNAWFCCTEPNGNTWLKATSTDTTPPSSSVPATNDSKVEEPPKQTVETFNSAKLDSIEQLTQERNKALAGAIDGSIRLFGLPHQFTAATDHRLNNITNLGRVYTETFIMEAPSIYIKPGTSNFLPGMSDSDKTAFATAIAQFEASDANAKSLKDKLVDMTKDATYIKYFDFIPRYNDYMTKVNMLCRLCAVFMGIHKERVPWVDNPLTTFGNYDWRYYSFKSTYHNKKFDYVSDDIANKSPLDAFRETLKGMTKDDTYVRFYVDAGMSFNESASNGTTSSALTTITDQLSSIGKELAFISGAGAGIAGYELDEAIKAGNNAVEAWIDQNFTGQASSLGGMFSRLFSTTNQLIAGGNFLVPEIWNSSDYSKSYSFNVHLSTPYGNPKSIYINIMVPLMHILAMALPTQVGANAYTSPNLVKAFSPGWFSCDMGIIDSISIDKAGAGDAWSASGLPTEMKISVGIKDLYSNLAFPEHYSIKEFFTNDNLMHYLMVNCGVDITDQNFSTKIDVIANMFAGSIQEKINAPINQIWTAVKQQVRQVWNLYN